MPIALAMTASLIRATVGLIAFNGPDAMTFRATAGPPACAYVQARARMERFEANRDNRVRACAGRRRHRRSDARQLTTGSTKDATMDFRDLIPFGRDRGNVPVRREGGEHPMEMFQREVNRLFEDFSRDFFRTPTPFGGDNEVFASIPRVDVSESENEYEVTAELLGIDEKDVVVTLADNVLTIRGEKKVEREEKDKDKNYYLSERASAPSGGPFHSRRKSTRTGWKPTSGTAF
jgi:HSP20 family molecular chaperone IbpA